MGVEIKVEKSQQSAVDEYRMGDQRCRCRMGDPQEIHTATT
jgi:hypothetical protein